jgi:Antitoxin VbhA
MTASHVTAAERERRVAEALHSGEMEGFTVDPCTKNDSDDYIAGVIDSDELVARARERYGLA